MLETVIFVSCKCRTKMCFLFSNKLPLKQLFPASPTAYDSDNLSPDGIDRTIYQNVTRDEGIVANASDWFNICGLDIYKNGAVPFVGLFIDNSGSMTTSTVQASYDKFLAEIATAGLTISLVQNTDENWILPFLTELAPPTP